MMYTCAYTHMCLVTACPTPMSCLAVQVSWTAALVDLLVACSTLADAAIAAYEYVMTIPQEVALGWKKSWTGSSLLFMVNRYSMIANVIFIASPMNSTVRRISAWLQSSLTHVSRRMSIDLGLISGVF